MHGSTYPILCYPTTLPKVANDLTTHPTLHVALDKVKDDQHGVSYFKMFSFLLQEMTFEADENFLYALMDFAQFKNAPTVPEQRYFLKKKKKKGIVLKMQLDCIETKCLSWRYQNLPLKKHMHFITLRNFAFNLCA